VVSSYRLGANCYFKKPSEWDEFVSIAKAIKDFLVDPGPVASERMKSRALRVG